MKWDIMDITLPWNHFISECIRSGELPLWNPYLKNGFPTMGLLDTWYPVTWLISIVFGMDVWSIQMDYLLHLLIAGYGMFSFASLKKIDSRYGLALGVCYMFSGFMVGNAQHLGWVIGAAWLPWVIYYFDKLMESHHRADLLKFAAVSAFLFYGAYPAITIIVVYILIIKFAFMIFSMPKDRRVKTISNLVICFILFACIAAVGLIGLWELAPQLNRGGQLPLSNTGWGVLSGFLPVQAMSSFLIPHAGTSVEGFWGSDISLINCYFGFIVMMTMFYGLLLKSKQTWTYYLLGSICLMIAMSEVFPFRAWLYHLPLFDKFRFPSLFRLFAIFFYLIASGFAYTELRKSTSFQKTFKIVSRLAFIGLFSIFFFSWLHAGSGTIGLLFSEGLQIFNKAAGFYDKACVGLIIQLLLLGGLLTYSYLNKNWFKHIYIFIILEVLMISQFNISETVIHFGDPEIGNKEIQKFEGQAMAVDLFKPMNTYNDGYWKDELSWFRFNQASITKTPSASGNSPFSLLRHKEAKNNGDLGINKQPLLFFADIIDQKIVEPSIDVKSYEHINLLSADHKEIVFQTQYDKATDLIFLQNYYPGWKVTVDGKEDSIQRVNTTFMSLPLAAGKHMVKFSFEPMMIKISFWVSLFSFLTVLLAVIYYQIKEATP